MSAETLARAPSGVTWDGINWADVQRQVRRLQARFVKATQESRHNKVKALQWCVQHLVDLLRQFLFADRTKAQDGPFHSLLASVSVHRAVYPRQPDTARDSE